MDCILVIFFYNYFMRNYTLLVLSVILLNGIFHCPNVHAESLNHACHDQAECVFEGDSNCPESSEIAISKKSAHRVIFSAILPQNEKGHFVQKYENHFYFCFSAYMVI